MPDVILWQIRMPRVLVGAMVGAALAVSGAVMQGLFRNPLADPGLVGISAGASLGAVTYLVIGAPLAALLPHALAIYGLPISAAIGGLAATLVLYRIATREGRTSIATMLLAGIALAALVAAMTGLLIYMADDRQLRDITFWSLGSLGGANWEKAAAIAPFLLVPMIAVPLLADGLDGLLLGEATARHLGIGVETLKRVAIAAVAAYVGAAVAAAGPIAFVGIVVPHVLRLAIGPRHRGLLPASALLGAVLLLAADAVARTVVAPAELPIGILTALFGAPLFLWLLLKRRMLVDL
ncbi:FecCD family ABC transporter permease [Lutibaculum baratangense]|uniref:Hemin ABC transporter, permease protein n=1 Tax=Lutibaculum baratangense AMV1 TaxID=631454 RepID=V4QW03_9HYPH|nr:iron ABC transporter permease [Lutibaculum baratangense]ESR23892.1 Hemin ABC transporter, permease protein [Lutibaculum baratangense AMV1]